MWLLWMPSAREGPRERKEEPVTPLVPQMLEGNRPKRKGIHRQDLFRPTIPLRKAPGSVMVSGVS